MDTTNEPEINREFIKGLGFVECKHSNPTKEFFQHKNYQNIIIKLFWKDHSYRLRRFGKEYVYNSRKEFMQKVYNTFQED